jgi:hypothetical protein
MRKDGYGQVLTYVTQQIEQFQREGEPFAMQHLGTDDELVKVWREDSAFVVAGGAMGALTPEELVEKLAPGEALEG